LTLKLIDIVTSLELSKKRVRSSTTTKYVPFGENLVKIGLVDPEIICLKGLFKKDKKKLTQAEHIARSECGHTAWANNKYPMLQLYHCLLWNTRT